MTRNGQILRLRRHPDARLGRWKLLPAMLLGYVGLLLGPAVAGVLAAVNALSLRRFGLAASMLLFGALSWVACGMAAVLVAKFAGVKSIGMLIITSRLLSATAGIAMAFYMAPHVRGHEFLRGRVVSLLEPVLAGTVLTFVLPARPLLVVAGFWPLLFWR